MDFAIPARMQPILAGMQRFMTDEIYPLERRGVSFAELVPELKQKRALVRERGWFAPQLPKEWGGMGLSLQEHGLVSEVLGKSFLGHYVFNCQAPDAGNMEI